MTYTLIVQEPEPKPEPPQDGEKCVYCGAPLARGQRRFCSVCWAIFEEEDATYRDEMAMQDDLRRGG